MDFFAQQDLARRRTKWLLGYFVLSIVGLILSLYLVLLTISGLNKKSRRAPVRDSRGYVTGYVTKPMSLWQPELLLWSALGSLSVILVGSGYKTLQLSAGGSVVARDLGGRLLDRNTRDPDERKLLNVVEEMAIASGMPVPDVYLLDHEEGVNAFAAGRTTGDAVVGVTRGCMRLLSRDELQGVIAHEFSHILNGDMRLNLRLIGLVHGILVIALIGRTILEAAARSGSSSRDGDKARMGAFLFGLAITAIGYVGVMCGRLIKAAISRQREFLADASAVQFTRHPDGIGRALMKIGGLSAGSLLKSPKAEEASHMMFSNALKASFSSAFETHPPLEKRIKAILPHWDGSYPRVRLPEIAARRTAPRLPDFSGAAAAGFAGAVPPRLSSVFSVSPTEAIDHMGQITEQELAQARQICAAISPDWHDLLRSSAGAQAMMFALILSQEEGLREAELAQLRRVVDPETLSLTVQLQPEVEKQHSSVLIAVIDLAIPALRRLSPPEYQRFTEILHALMASDQRVDLFEFMVQKILRRHLDLWFHKAAPPRVVFTKLAQIAEHSGQVLALLASVGGRNAGAAAAAYAEGSRQFQMSGVTLPPFDPNVPLATLDLALDQLERASSLLKKQFLYACGRTVLADRALTNEEAELLRAIADTIGCPIPPFVAQAKLAQE